MDQEHCEHHNTRTKEQCMMTVAFELTPLWLKWPPWFEAALVQCCHSSLSVFFLVCCSLVCLQTVSFSSSKDLVCVFARRFGDAWPLVPALVSQRRMGAGRKKREKLICGKCDAANFISHRFCTVCGRL